MADLSEHLGRSGEFLIGLVGLAFLLLMHPDIRRFAAEHLSSFGAFCVHRHKALEANNGFYQSWSNAFRTLFRERRDLFLIVLSLTAFDYLTNWHSNFIFRAYDLYPDYDYATLGGLRSLIFSAATVLGLLRAFGYALFCWLAFRIASGDTYKQAVKFRPLRRVAGLFLCLSGCEVFSGAVTPYVILHGQSMIGDISSIVALAGALIYGGLFCLIGARLFNARFNGRIALATLTAIAGYLLLTHVLQWLFYLTDLPAPARTPWLRMLNYHVSDFTYTLLWNVLMVGFAIVLANPARAHSPSAHEQSDRAADAV